MLIAVRSGAQRWLDRFGRFARAAEAAAALGLPARRALDRRWGAAVSTVNFALLPRAVRDQLRVVVDVGANRGDWSDAILRLGRPGLAYAFEPNPSVFRTLEARLAPRGVRCIQAAVGATEGRVRLHVEAQSELSSVRELSNRGRAIHGIESAPTRQIDVPLVTLDSALHDVSEISLLKLDVQGYESNVLAGAQRSLNRTRCLVTEVMYERDYYRGATSCLELARAIEDLSPLRLSCISAPALAPDGLGAWADAVFVHRSELAGSASIVSQRACTIQRHSRGRLSSA
jgi:FkbM family methyltransferase